MAHPQAKTLQKQDGELGHEIAPVGIVDLRHRINWFRRMEIAMGLLAATGIIAAICQIVYRHLQ